MLAEAESTSGTELIADFWDSSPAIDAVNAACRSLVQSAAEEGHSITSSVCQE